MAFLIKFLEIEDGFAGDEGFDEVESTKLSLKEKLILWFIGFISFVIFFIYIFPFEELGRYFIARATAPSGVIIDFKKLNFSYFGSRSVDSLVIQTPSTVNLKTEKLELNASLINLVSGKFDGTLDLISFNFENSSIEFLLRNVLLKGKLSNVLEGDLLKLQGTTNIDVIGGSIVKSPFIAEIDSDLSGVKIKNISGELQFNKGSISLSNILFSTSIASIKLNGRIVLNKDFNNSNLDLSLCPRLTKSFANERPHVESFLQLYKMQNKTDCIEIKGTFSRPALPALSKMMGPGAGGSSAPSAPSMPANPANNP